MFCPKCGEKNPDGARFCARCGAAIAAAGPVSGPVPAPPRRRSRVPLVAACAVAAVAVVVAAVLVLPGLLGGGRAAQERQASNAALNGGYKNTVVSSGDYDYLYSASVGGICRVKSDGSSAELIRPIDSAPYHVSALAIDGDTLYFALEGNAPSEIRSIQLDGTNEKSLVTLATEPNEFNQRVAQICVYDGALYVTSYVYDPYEMTCTWNVYTVHKDGSDIRQVFTLDGDYLAIQDLLVLPDAVYYLENGNGGDFYTLNAWDSDTNQVRALYTGTSAYASELCMVDGQLIFIERGSGSQQVMCFGTDGQEQKTLWSGEGAMIATVADGSVYLSVPNSDGSEGRSLLRVPLDGSAEQTVAQNLLNTSHSVSDVGGRLVVCENATETDDTSVLQAISMNYDGTNQVMYPLG